jgi:hypothetical protein
MIKSIPAALSIVPLQIQEMMVEEEIDIFEEARAAERLRREIQSQRLVLHSAVSQLINSQQMT